MTQDISERPGMSQDISEYPCAGSVSPESSWAISKRPWVPRRLHTAGPCGRQLLRTAVFSPHLPPLLSSPLLSSHLPSPLRASSPRAAGASSSTFPARRLSPRSANSANAARPTRLGPNSARLFPIRRAGDCPRSDEPHSALSGTHGAFMAHSGFMAHYGARSECGRSGAVT